MCNLFMSSVDCLDYNYVISGLPSDSEINIYPRKNIMNYIGRFPFDGIRTDRPDRAFGRTDYQCVTLRG